MGKQSTQNLSPPQPPPPFPFNIAEKVSGWFGGSLLAPTMIGIFAIAALCGLVNALM